MDNCTKKCSFISANTRNRNWGKGVLTQISERLRGELPGLRGFGERNLKNMNKEYVNYVMQDFLQPMGVATYKTADEVESEIIKLLPPKEELMKLIDAPDPQSLSKEDKK